MPLAGSIVSSKTLTQRPVVLNFKLLFSALNRRAGLADDPEYIVETSQMDEMSIAEFRAILDDSPTDELEVISDYTKNSSHE